MHPIITLLIIAAVALIGYFFPKKYNEYFFDEYHQDAISMPLAVATAIFSSLWLIFMDLDGFWYWFLLIAAILLCVISVLRAIYVGICVKASALEIVLATIAQFFATAGTLILILGILMLFFKILGGKKKK